MPSAYLWTVHIKYETKKITACNRGQLESYFLGRTEEERNKTFQTRVAFFLNFLMVFPFSQLQDLIILVNTHLTPQIIKFNVSAAS